MSASVLPDPEDQPTIPLWPTAGRALGLGRATTYTMAARGEIPGLLTFGRRKVVATAALRRALHLDTPRNDEAGSSEDPATSPNTAPQTVATTLRSSR